MLIEILIAVLLGILFGIISGLIPGIHLNLISLTAVSLATTLILDVNPILIAVFIVSLAVTHTFLDSIPSIFLGAPDETTVLSVLPGHKMLLKGKAHEAILLTVIGSLFSLLIAILLSPILFSIIPSIYSYIENIIGYILLIVSIFLIFREKNSKFWALSIFLLAGILGILTLNLGLIKNPLFPLLSGLFGISILITSINQKIKIPKQTTAKEINTNKKTISKALTGTILAGTFTSFLPGLGPAQAAIIGSQLFKNLSEKGFLILVGGLNTINMVLSFLGLFLINKARNGAVVSISKIIENISLNQLILFLGVSLLVAGIATFLAIKFSKLFSKLITKLNYKLLVVTVISFITILTYFLSGVWGLLILLVSSSIGMLPTFKGIGKNHLMGCLLIPVMLYFLL